MIPYSVPFLLKQFCKDKGKENKKTRLKFLKQYKKWQVLHSTYAVKQLYITSLRES